MRKVTLIMICLCLGASVSRAQAYSDPVNSTVTLENNFRNALWFNSGNAAGMQFTPLRDYNELKLVYDKAGGAFHLKRDPESYNDVSFNTSGALVLSGIRLWGDFSFRNLFEKGAEYNTVRYAPEDDMPYFVADSVASGWTKQEYLLSLKAASPVLWDRVAFGVGLNYESKVGAKQNDPRTETYRYKVEVIPGAAASFGKLRLGLNAFYRNDFERSDPRNEGAFSKVVWITRGLGEYQTTKVGDNDGLKEFYYKESARGAGLQAEWCGGADILADFSFTKKTVDCLHNVKLPKRMGSIDQNLIEADVQALFGDKREHRIVLNACYRATSGLEHIQMLNTEAFNQRWEVVATNEMSRYNRISADLAYDWEIGNQDTRGYDWKIGATAGMLVRDEMYTLPASSDNSTSVRAGLNGTRQFKFDGAALAAGLDVLFNKSLGGEYLYGGENTTAVVLDLYRSDNAWYTSDYAGAGLDLAYTRNLKRLNWFVEANASYIYPAGMDVNRFVCKLSAGIIF